MQLIMRFLKEVIILQTIPAQKRVIILNGLMLHFMPNIVNPIQDALPPKALNPPSPPRTSFYPVTSTNVGISPKNFVSFSFATLGAKCQVRT